MRKLSYKNVRHEIYKAAAMSVRALNDAVEARDYIAFAIIAPVNIKEEPVIAYRLSGDAYYIEPELIMRVLKEASSDGVLSGAYVTTVRVKTFIRNENYKIISDFTSTQKAWFGVMPLYEDTAVSIELSGLGKHIRETFNKNVEIDAKLQAGSGGFITDNWRKIRHRRLEEDILGAKYAIVSNADKIMSQLLGHVRSGARETALIVFPHPGDKFFKPTAIYAVGEDAEKERELYEIAERTLSVAHKVRLGKASGDDYENLNARVLHIARGGAFERLFEIVLVCQTDKNAYVFDENGACDDVDDTVDAILANGCAGNVKPIVWDEIGDYLCRF